MTEKNAAYHLTQKFPGGPLNSRRFPGFPGFPGVVDNLCMFIFLISYAFNFQFGIESFSSWQTRLLENVSASHVFIWKDAFLKDVRIVVTKGPFCVFERFNAIIVQILNLIVQR